MRLWQRHRRRLGMWLVACSLQPGVSALAQDATGSIAGIVETVDRPGQPLPHAIVSVSHPGTSVQISVVADDAGRFRFDNLRAGAYAVTATKAAYLTSAIGARRPAEPGTSIALAPGQHVGDLRLTLTRGAVIAGFLRDAAGVPAASIPIVVAPAETAMGLGTYAPGTGLITDDRGAFRAFGLLPGEYVVAAALSEHSGSGNTYRPTIAEIDMGLFALQERQAGRPTATDGPAASSALVRHQAYGSAPVFYPGTTDVGEARRIRVGPGEVREDVSFAIGLAPLFSVAGSVVEPDGTVAQATTVITRVGPPLPIYTTPSTALIRQNQSSGNFSFPGLAPGRYVVHSRSKEGRWASADVRITNRDVRQLTLVLEPLMSLEGRIAFATSSASRPPDIATVRVGLERRGPDGQPAPVEASRTGPASVAPPATELRPVNPDGTFVITEIPPGRFVLTAVTPFVSGPNWWLASAMAAGRDLLDMPLNFGTDVRSLTEVVLTFSDRPAALTGRLQTPAGGPATDYFVIVFSADRAHWFPGARRTRAVRPATDGVFSVSELPAGAYLVAAVTDAYPDEWQRAEFLNQLASFAVPVTIRAGETVRQDLQIAGR